MEGVDPKDVEKARIAAQNINENWDENQAEEIFDRALFSWGEAAGMIENSAFHLNTINGNEGGLVEGSTDTKPDRKRPVSWRIGSAYTKQANGQRDNQAVKMLRNTMTMNRPQQSMGNRKNPGRPDSACI